MSAFGDIRGAIDGTHVLAHVPASQRAAYRNRKGEISQNVLAGCSLDMYFFYVCPGWEGSANDARVLENAELNGFPREENALYLADAGYGLRRGFLTPYRTVRYHLREQSLARLRPQTKEELFNLRHAQLRNVIERLFGVLHCRFHILNSRPEYDLAIQAQLVLVVCALHNFIRHQANGEEDDFYKETDLSRNEDDTDILLDGQTGVEPSSQIDSVQLVDMGEMVLERDRRATKMWIDYVTYQNRNR